MLKEVSAKAFCINLARRSDRWKECEAEFSRFGLKVNRFEAVEVSQGNQYITKPQLGCLLSHLVLVKQAQTEGLETITVFEDDVAFDRDLVEKFDAFCGELPSDWEMLYWGGNHSEFGARPMEMLSSHVGRLKKTLAAHAYSLRASAYERIIEYISPAEIPLDMYYAELQGDLKAYGFSPNLATQRTSFSDINEEVVNYSFIIPVNR